MLIQRIKEDSLQARKAGDRVRASLLITLLSEAQAVGKNAGNREPTDEEVTAVIKKFIKNAEQTAADATKSIALNKMDVIQSASEEVKTLSSYLPKQLSEDEIATIISGLKAGEIMEPTMGNIMAYFKKMYPGQYDGALVARHAR